VAADTFLIWFISKIGSAKKSLRILAIAIGCKHKIINALLLLKLSEYNVYNMKMKQNNLTVNKLTIVDNMN
jgi:hypothetical protein